MVYYEPNRSRRLRLLHQRESKRLRRFRQRESIMKQPGTTKQPYTKCLWEVQKKPLLGIRPDLRELLVLPSLTVDGKLFYLVYPTQPLSSMAGRIRQYAICYDCGSNETEIVKSIKCVICGAKKRTLLMVACQETWPARAERVAQKCSRCSCAQPDRSSLQQCIYTITCSSQDWGNRPVCCDCYMVPVPCRHIPNSS